MNDLPILQVPEPGPDLDDQTALQRACIILWGRILQLEHWLSPNGQVRALLRRCLQVLIPAAILLPITLLLLYCVAAIVEVIARIVEGMLVIVGGFLLLGLFVSKHR